MRRVLPVGCATLVLLAATACTSPGPGSGGVVPEVSEPSPSQPQSHTSSGPTVSDSGSPVPTDTDAATSLTITLREVADTGDEPVTFTLQCDPVGGSLPVAATACENLAMVTVDPFAPVPSDRLCLDVIEGPGQITATGRWEGDAVDAQFSLRNSCETARFYEFLRILGLS